MARKKSLFTDLVNDYKGLLLTDKRDGMKDLLEYMEDCKFFDAPCSGGNHLCEPGGLVKHSLNVYHIAKELTMALYGDNIPDGFAMSVGTCALLHDVGKCGDYGKQLYVPNILKSGEQSKAKPYERNKQLTNVPHAFRSVIIAERFIDLTEEEEWAIMYHDGLYDRETGGMAIVPGHETPLWMIIHWSDMWASHVTEIEKEDE